MKNGEGKFLYLDKGQVYTGSWKEDVAKCGVLEVLGMEGVPNPPAYPLPQVSKSSELRNHWLASWYTDITAACQRRFLAELVE